MTTGRPIDEAPRDGTTILVEIMNRSGVPATGGYGFSLVKADPDSSGYWIEIERTAGNVRSLVGHSSILRWFPGDTDPTTLTLTPRTNWNYRPSSGSEGESFYEDWCEGCIHERPIREDYDNAIAQGLGCAIWMKTHLFDIDDPRYPTEWTHDRETKSPKCTAFERDTGQSQPRCAQTNDLFNAK